MSTMGPPLLPSGAVSATLREPQSATVPGAPAAESVVSLAHVTKEFRLPHEQYHTLKERALHPFRSRSVDVLKAVDDVTVDINKGEFFGIVGRNGSGKSTLLKCLAGIYETTAGTLAVKGRLSPFIELGVGFNPDLTARDNVVINAIMLGLSRREAIARFDRIVAFAELEEFMDLKLKNYSSGMHVRLAFAVAIQVDADVVLIDEVLAVGDASFQQKCYDEFARMKREGRTILFVTHDMGAVERFCDRAMLLERGRVVRVGPPAEVAREYNEMNFVRIREEAKETGTGADVLRRRPVAEVMSAHFESAPEEPIVTIEQGAHLQARVEVRFHEACENPIFAVSLQTEAGTTAFATSTQLAKIDTGHYAAGEVATVRLPFENWLAPGRYRLIASVAHEGHELDLLDMHTESTIIVFATQAGGGAVDLPHRFEIGRG